jgi:hypothetical protein
MRKWLIKGSTEVAIFAWQKRYNGKMYTGKVDFRIYMG